MREVQENGDEMGILEALSGWKMDRMTGRNFAFFFVLLIYEGFFYLDTYCNEKFLNAIRRQIKAN